MNRRAASIECSMSSLEGWTPANFTKSACRRNSRSKAWWSRRQIRRFAHRRQELLGRQFRGSQFETVLQIPPHDAGQFYVKRSRFVRRSAAVWLAACPAASGRCRRHSAAVHVAARPGSLAGQRGWPAASHRERPDHPRPLGRRRWRQRGELPQRRLQVRLGILGNHRLDLKLQPFGQQFVGVQAFGRSRCPLRRSTYSIRIGGIA